MLRKHFNIYIKKKTFWEHQIGKQAPYLESTRKKLCEEVIGLIKREGKKRKKKRKEKKKVNDWQSCSLTISDSVVCREKKRID